MIDVSLLRDHRDVLEAEVAKRELDLDLDGLAALDEERRRVRAESEELRARQKTAGKEIAQLSGDEKQRAIDAVSAIAEEYKALDARADELDEEFHRQWVRFPNLAHESVPVGDDETGNLEVKTWGDPDRLGFEPRDHLELGDALGVIDTERASRVSGSRFGFLIGDAARLELGLVNWAMDHLMGAGFTPVIPPVLVREEALFGTGFFPSDKDEVYEIPADELFLAGTSEIPIASFHADEILDAAALPVRYAGFSTCFRREAGTYGKDTRGIWRVHQFDKVEMFTFSHPDASWDEHDRMLAIEEELVQALDIPYRVVNVCTGDLGFPAAKKYDIEAWIPSAGEYKEITSTSNTTDYQARRLNIRYRADGENRLVHTLNGTAVAIGRWIVALLENHQQTDGSVVVPEPLRAHVGFEVMKPA